MSKVALKQIERNGRTALVLSYSVNGKRKQESTKLYLLKGKDKQTKETNKETLKAAESIRREKERLLAEDKVADHTPTLLEYFHTVRKRRELSEKFAQNTTDKWIQSEKKLKGYLASIGKQDMPINRLTISMLEGYKDWLFGSNGHGNKPLSNVSVNIYTSKLGCVLRYALSEDLIGNNVALYRLNIKEERKEVQFLTKEQVDALTETPCREQYLKEAFLFGCNCGLRISDISNLTWQQIDFNGKIMRLTTQKTKTKMEQPLNNKAIEILNSLPRDTDKVFGTLCKRKGCIRRYLIEWFRNAGITNVRPHFHLSRDTFANLLIGKGIDLKTISVLLSHASIQTTERHYIGKLSNESKRSAIDTL